MIINVTVPLAEVTAALKSLRSWKAVTAIDFIGENRSSVGLSLDVLTTPLSVGASRQELEKRLRKFGAKIGIRDRWWRTIERQDTSPLTPDMEARWADHAMAEAVAAESSFENQLLRNAPLGQRLAPHLPLLRRYARSLTGNQSEGDMYVRATLEAIVADPTRLDRDLELRTALYRLFHLTWRSSVDGSMDALRGIPDPRFARIALILTGMEGFDREETGMIIGVAPDEVAVLVEFALRDFASDSARILIIEDDPIIAADLADLASARDHVILGIAETEQEAVRLARDLKPDVVLADIDLGSGGSGIDAVQRIREFAAIRVIFITAYPERLLTGIRPEPTFLITKPFIQSTVSAALVQAMINEPLAMLNSEGSVLEIDPGPSADNEAILFAGDELKADDFGSRNTRTITVPDLELELEHVSVAPLPGPVDAEVINGTLRRAPRAIIAAKVGQASVEALRRRHLRTAVRFQTELVGRNLGNAFTARLEEIQVSLSEPLTETTGLDLGVQADGLMQMAKAIEAELGAGSAADVTAFISDITKLAWMFPDFEAFSIEARKRESMNGEARAALFGMSRELENLPAAVIEPELKAEVAAMRINAEEAGGPIADLALLRTVSNLLRGYGRFLKRRWDGGADNAAKSFDKVNGGVIAVVGYVLLASGPLSLLAYHFPTEFGFVVLMAKHLKLMLQF